MRIPFKRSENEEYWDWQNRIAVNSGIALPLIFVFLICLVVWFNSH